MASYRRLAAKRRTAVHIVTIENKKSPGRWGGEGALDMKGTGMHVVSRGVNFGFWSHLDVRAKRYHM